MAFSFYNNGPYLSLGSMNSVNVKVIHMGGNDPTVLIKKFKDTRSFLSCNGAMFNFLVIIHCMLMINTVTICSQEVCWTKRHKEFIILRENYFFTFPTFSESPELL